MAIRVTVSVPRDTLEEIDAARGDVPRSRWMLRVIEKALDGRTSGPPPPEAVEAVVSGALREKRMSNYERRLRGER